MMANQLGQSHTIKSLMSFTDEDELAMRIKRRKEETLRSIITLAIGEGWTLKSLRGRLLTKRYPDGIEVVCIDGKEVAEFHPLRFDQIMEDGVVKLRAIQNYRILLPNKE